MVEYSIPISSQIESARTLNTAFPDKFWLKQQFSIGVNEVTRVLERMPPNLGTESYSPDHLLKSSKCDGRKAPSIRLQAVLLASDCNPRWLTKHLPALAASRKVPLIFIKDNKEGSLRLGELVKLKTAIAIGIQSISVENTVSIRYCVLTNKTDEA
ncbi:Ribosomal protein L7Ae/L30e/S12e/Gadd45 family protein [Forsythia ovata]|uniref:Ribosomal protein L7Ae/L30e/S12e/Gadd45 family protein n=1 Tax=Forsythia ovata TaxID=205694 RepID=A0ABD1NXP2_9LAMI